MPRQSFFVHENWELHGVTGSCEAAVHITRRFIQSMPVNSNWRCNCIFYYFIYKGAVKSTYRLVDTETVTQPNRLPFTIYCVCSVCGCVQLLCLVFNIASWQHSNYLPVITTDITVHSKLYNITQNIFRLNPCASEIIRNFLNSSHPLYESPTVWNSCYSFTDLEKIHGSLRFGSLSRELNLVLLNIHARCERVGASTNIVSRTDILLH